MSEGSIPRNPICCTGCIQGKAPCGYHRGPGLSDARKALVEKGYTMNGLMSDAERVVVSVKMDGAADAILKGIRNIVRPFGCSTEYDPDSQKVAAPCDETDAQENTPPYVWIDGSELAWHLPPSLRRGPRVSDHPSRQERSDIPKVTTLDVVVTKDAGEPVPYDGYDAYDPSEWVIEVMGLLWRVRSWTSPYDFRIYRCLGRDPRNGFWMQNIHDPSDMHNISERAINRTWYRADHISPMGLHRHWMTANPNQERKGMEDPFDQWVKAHPEVMQSFAKEEHIAIHPEKGVVAHGLDFHEVFEEVKRQGLLTEVIFDSAGWARGEAW